MRPHVSLFLLALLVLAGCADALTNSPKSQRTEAILRVDRQSVVGSASDFNIYRETQAQLLKSNFVVTAALRDPIVSSKFEGLTAAALSNALHVELMPNSELVRVAVDMPRRPSDDRELLLNQVLDSFQREIVNSERLEKIESLAKLRKRYQTLFDGIRKKTDEIASLERNLLAQASSSNNVQLKAELDRRQRRIEELERLRTKLQLKHIEFEKLEQKTKAEVKVAQIEFLSQQLKNTLDESAKSGSASGELEARADDLAALRRDMQTVRQEMQALEIELDSRPTVTVIQKATSR